MPAPLHSSLVALLAVGGGHILDLAGLPLAWLLGAALTTALYGLVVSPVRFPDWGFRSAQVIVGVGVGLSVSAKVLSGLGWQVPLVLAAALLSVLIGRALLAPYARLGGVDRTTAHFALMPAGIAEMADMAAKKGGDPGAVALLHALRVLMVVLILPFLVYATGNPAASVLPGAAAAWTPQLAAAIAIGAASGAIGNRLGLASAYMLAPMLVISVLSGSGLLSAGEPGILLAVAQIVLGCTLGARFRRDTLRRLPRAAIAAIPVMIFHGAVMIGLALAVSRLFGLPSATMVLAFATGGTAEMVLTAHAVGADAALVAIYQITRGLVGNGLAVPLHHWTVRPAEPQDP